METDVLDLDIPEERKEKIANHLVDIFSEPSLGYIKVRNFIFSRDEVIGDVLVTGDKETSLLVATYRNSGLIEKMLDNLPNGTKIVKCSKSEFKDYDVNYKVSWDKYNSERDNALTKFNFLTFGLKWDSFEKRVLEEWVNENDTWTLLGLRVSLSKWLHYTEPPGEQYTTNSVCEECGEYIRREVSDEKDIRYCPNCGI